MTRLAVQCPKAVQAAFVGMCSLLISACHAPDPAPLQDWSLACDYASFESTPDKLNSCAARDADGELMVRADLLGDIEAGSGIQSIHVDGDWLFAFGGKTATALTYDNGPDYFQQDRARIIQGGKVGFIDESMNLVIAPSWDFAFPFENGYAMVCMACVQESDGEHSLLTGGTWGMIDRMGEIVLEPVYQRELLPAPPDGNPGSENL